MAGDVMIKKKFIRLVRNGKQLLRMKVKETPLRYNTNKGEVDILIDSAAKTKSFDVACLQTEKGRTYCENPVNSASWHGYYDERENPVKLPIINFKYNHDKIFSSRHRGIVQQENIFLFPICSVYIPSQFDTSDLTEVQEREEDIIIEMDDRSNVRADFFILPKGVTVDEFVSNISISVIYFMSDITIFNKSLRGEFRPLPVNRDEDVEFLSMQVGEWDMLVRIMYTEKTNEPDLCGKYSLLFHDPNETIDMLLDRTIGFPNEDGSVEYVSMKERYSSEINRFKM